MCFMKTREELCRVPETVDEFLKQKYFAHAVQLLGTARKTLDYDSFTDMSALQDIRFTLDAKYNVRLNESTRQHQVGTSNSFGDSSA